MIDVEHKFSLNQTEEKREHRSWEHRSWEQGRIIDNLWIRIDFIFDFWRCLI